MAIPTYQHGQMVHFPVALNPRVYVGDISVGVRIASIGGKIIYELNETHLMICIEVTLPTVLQIKFASVAQLIARWICKPRVGGSNLHVFTSHFFVLIDRATINFREIL